MMGFRGRCFMISPDCMTRNLWHLFLSTVLLRHCRACHLKVDSNVPSFKNKKNKFWRRAQYIIRSKTSVERIKLLVFLSVWLELWAFVLDVHIGTVISKQLVLLFFSSLTHSLVLSSIVFFQTTLCSVVARLMMPQQQVYIQQYNVSASPFNSTSTSFSFDFSSLPSDLPQYCCRRQNG